MCDAVSRELVCFVSTQDLESNRQVEFEEVAEYCRSIKCPLVEASAKVYCIYNII